VPPKYPEAHHRLRTRRSDGTVTVSCHPAPSAIRRSVERRSTEIDEILLLRRTYPDFAHLPAPLAGTAYGEFFTMSVSCRFHVKCGHQARLEARFGAFALTSHGRI
jgi:hypothetical protein